MYIVCTIQHLLRLSCMMGEYATLDLFLLVKSLTIFLELCHANQMLCIIKMH